MSRGPRFTPFAERGRRSMSAILLTFALSTAIGVSLSISATAKSQHRAAVLEVAARQRSLAERYVKEVLLSERGASSDPRGFAAVMIASAQALLHGGTAPPVQGDDDANTLPPTDDPVLRLQLGQEARLVSDLTSTGAAILNDRSVMNVTLKAGERIETTDPIERLRVLAALTSNVSLNAARTIAVET